MASKFGDFSLYISAVILVNSLGWTKIDGSPVKLGTALSMATKVFLKNNNIPWEKLTGWWYPYPSEENEFVSWDDEIPNIWKVIKFHGSKPPTSDRFMESL